MQQGLLSILLALSILAGMILALTQALLFREEQQRLELREHNCREWPPYLSYQMQLKVFFVFFFIWRLESFEPDSPNLIC